MASDFDISKIEGFDWDNGNKDKNFIKHNVENQEAEEVFSNSPFISEDFLHSSIEERYQALGPTNKGRLLFVSFTVRKSERKLKVRIISARDMNRKEEVKYAKVQKDTKI